MSNFASYPSLKDMPVVISGGASGIGEGIVREFAAQGAKVGFVDIQADRGEALAKELTAAGHTVSFAACDITDIEKYRAALGGFAEQHGPTLALINNAGHDLRHKLADVTPEFWDDRIAVNLKHAFFAAQAVAPGMIAAKRGSIVNFGSISWMIIGCRQPLGLHREQGGDARHVAFARTRTRTERHPRQHAGPRLDHDRAPAHPLGRREGKQTDR